MLLAPSPADTSFLQESLVVPHDQLGFDLLYCIHCHGHDNQQGGPSKLEIDSETGRNEIEVIGCQEIVQRGTDAGDWLHLESGD